MTPNPAKKRLFVFDLDGTLAKSKTPMDEEMAGLINQLLDKAAVAVIGGGWFPQFKKQLLVSLTASDEELKRLYLFPTSGSHFLRWDGEWKDVYQDNFSEEQRVQIMEAFEAAYKEIDYKHPPQLFGEVIEDRGSQITFSALGQEAPLDLKNAYKGSEQDRRFEIAAVLKEHLPDFEIRIPGKTSIDVTKKGIDKGYGVEQMRDHLGIPIEEMVFAGDALYEGGNDEPVKRTGIEAIDVEGPEDTKDLIRDWLKEM